MIPLKKAGFLLFLIFTFSIFYAQTNFYWFKKDVDDTFIKDKTKDLSYRSQMGATYFAIGNHYREALAAWDMKFGTKQENNEAEGLSNYKIVEAKKFILKKAKREQIIILNEAHHNARHRNFAKSLLKGLYRKGFRYLGVETLKNDSLNLKKFPTLTSGFYSQEPQFGLFLKEALSLGFKVFPYESKGNGKEREIGEAQNIYNFLRKNPQGKTLIYCGYAHAYEGKYPDWEKAMAERLKEYTGIDPFTIDQTQYSEKSLPATTSPLVTKTGLPYPAVLINKKGEPFQGQKKEYHTDAVILGVEAKYRHNKPAWMLTKGKNYIPIPKKNLQENLLVLAYKKGELAYDGVPEDITETSSDPEENYLILGKGAYEIVYENKDYKTIAHEELVVK